MRDETDAPDIPLVGGLAAVASRYDLVLSDVWGVVHDGVAHHHAAVAALARFRAGGGRVVLITNAPNPENTVRKRLDALAVPHDAYDGLVTSGDVTVSLILERGDIPIFHLGPRGEQAIYRAVEAESGRPVRLAPIEEAELVVCTGFFDAFSEKPADYDALLAAARARGLDFICANPDIVVHVGDDLMYCAGAIAERYAAIGGAVIHAGKPHHRIYELALRRAEAIAGKQMDRGRILAIGDALHTDIQGARNQGFASLFVTSGIHRADLHTAADNALDRAALRHVLAGTAFAPDALIPDLVW